MKRIRRLQGPIPGLAEYRKQAGPAASWRGYRSRPAGSARYRKIVGKLADLQHGLCGYCEIDLREGDRQVEHVIPVSDPNRGADYELDAGNMIACCRGGASDDPNVRQDPERFSPSEPSEESCGHAKGANVDPAFVDPRTLPDLPSLTRVRPSGQVEANTSACEAAGWSANDVDKTIQILGLNVQRLQRARRDYWNTLSGMMPKYHGDANAMRDWARTRLLPKRGSLPKFFTANRSYFGELGESVLAEAPRDWI